jgi:hypothetical protein
MHDEANLVIADLSPVELEELFLIYPVRHRNSVEKDMFSLIWHYIDLTEMVIIVETEK